MKKFFIYEFPFFNFNVYIFEHRYGPDAAKTTRDGMYSVGNVAISVNNIQNFKIVRTLAKATAKEVISSSASKSNLQQEGGEGAAAAASKSKNETKKNA